MIYRSLLLSTVLTYSAFASSDSTQVLRDSLKNSLLVQPASTHTFRQVIRREDFNAGLFADPLQLIQGKTMGLWIVQPNGDPAQRLETYSPGYSSAARNLSPMIIVDGVPNRPLSSLQPQDIDSIVVLRDAAALRAYGSRGLNGVLFIATRRPTEARLSASYLVQTAFESPARYQNLMSASQWRQYAPRFTNFYPASDGGSDTDWQRQVSRGVVNTNHLVTLGSTFQNGDISAAVGYLDRTGTIEKTGVGRFTSRLDGTYGLWHNRIKLTGSAWYANSREQQMAPGLADAVQQANPTINSTVRTKTILPVNVQFRSPFTIIDSVANETTTSYTGYRFAASVNPVPNLLISVQHVNSGFDATQNTLDQRLAQVSPYLFDTKTEAERQYRIELANRVNAGINSYKATVGTTDFTFQYNLPVKRSQINTWFNYTNNSIEGSYFVYGRMSTGYSASLSTDANPSFWNSFAAGLDYSLRNKFFLNLAYRQENYLESAIRSNRLGTNKSPATFPIVSLRWQPRPSLFVEYVWTKAEPLHASALHLEGDHPLNLLSRQFRTAQLPAQELFFQQVGRINWTSKGWNTNLEYIGSDKKTIGYVPATIAGQEILASASYTVRQHGINLQTGGIVVSRPNLSVNTSFVAGFLRTLIINWQGHGFIPLYNYAAAEPYSPFTSYVGYVMSFDAAGNVKQEDLNGDGDTDIADQKRVGSVYPTVTLGWSTSVNWRRLRATMLWRGSLGGAVQAPPARILSFYNGYRDLKLGDKNYLEELVALRASGSYSDDVIFSRTNTLNLQSTDHLRLDNLAVTYELTFNKLPINVGVFAQNLLTITKFPGNDPERSAYALDYSNSSAFYPRPRVVGLSAQIAWQRPKK
jgi:hypothetical protein